MPGTSSDKVFISYRQTHDEQSQRVREFALKLQGCGIEVILDQLYLDAHPAGPPEGWDKWSSDQALRTDSVIIIGTLGWFQCFEKTQPPGTGLGAACEADDLRHRIYKANGIIENIRVVIFEDADVEHISAKLKHYYRFHAERDFKGIVRWLGGKVPPTSPPSGVSLHSGFSGPHNPTTQQPFFGHEDELRKIAVKPASSKKTLSKLPRPPATSKRPKELGAIFGTTERPSPPELLLHPKKLIEIKSELLGPVRRVQAKIVGISGPRAIGKTTLALVIANDEDVRRKFRDGVFYIDSHRDGSLISQVLRLLPVDGLLTIDVREYFAERQALLIFNEPNIDNNYEDLRLLARHTRIIVATRNRTVLEKLRASIYDLGSLSPVEPPPPSSSSSSPTASEPTANIDAHSRTDPPSAPIPIPDWKERLRSGRMTLKEFFEIIPLGNSMNETDRRAFRLGAVLSVRHDLRRRYTQKSMDSYTVFAGYMLSAQPGSGQAEEALVQAALDINRAKNTSLADPNQPESAALWPLFSLRPLGEGVGIARQLREDLPNLELAAGLGRMVLRSIEIATQAGRPHLFSTRYLLACLLGPMEWHLDPEGTDEIKGLDLDLPALRRAFRDWMGQNRQDVPAVMNNVLGLADEPIQDASQVPDNATPAATSSSAYQQTYSAFVPDSVGYGRQVSEAPLDDALGVGVHAGHLAQLIAAKETRMPLSIGLFGAWGAGKSYFIDLLDEHLRALTVAPGKAFHKDIVQIRFNAWHYLDTNLWANLVCEIFDQLFLKLNEREGTTPQQVEKLKDELARQSALAAEANEALKTAEKAREAAEEKLRKAMQERRDEEGKVSALLNDLSVLLKGDEELQKQLHAAATGLGLPKLETSFAELEARVGEIHSLGGRFKALALAVFTGPWWWARALLLTVALVAPLLAVWLAENISFLQGMLEGAGRAVTQIVTTVTAFSLWISIQIKTGSSFISKLEKAYDKVKAVRAKRESQDVAAQAQKELAAKRQAEAEARHTLHEAENKMKTIRAEIAELAPGRQLIRFLKDRASAEDYRQHLGLVSLIRKDFEQLSNLLTRAGKGKDPSLPQIDRIVLYIDDLDRCRANRVIEVLEAVHLLLAFPLFAVVVAVDPRWLRQSLLDYYPNLLASADRADSREGAPRRGRPATPQDYLEKIFQVPFNLQTMEKVGYDSLVKQLFPIGLLVSNEPQSELAAPDPIAAGNSEPEDSSQLSDFGAQEEEREELEVSDNRPSETEPQGGPQRTRQLPPDPQRLVLTEWEVRNVQRFQALFQTPRAVKRFANTYCLIRVGVREAEWNRYLGTAEEPGDYHLPMFLLAVTSAFPSLARYWLPWLKDRKQVQWKLTAEDIASLKLEHSDTTDGEDWDRLCSSLNKLELPEWSAPATDLVKLWVPRVMLYSF